MNILITQDDIDKGEKRSCTKCPIALALKREGFDDVIVGDFGFFQTGPLRGFLSEDAIAFMIDFDSGYEVKPCIVKIRSYLDPI